jgi:adhesin/invasin
MFQRSSEFLRKLKELFGVRKSRSRQRNRRSLAISVERLEDRQAPAGLSEPFSIQQLSLSMAPIQVQIVQSLSEPVDASMTTVSVSPTSIESGDTATVTLTAKDASGNQEHMGGSKVVFSLGSGTAQGTFGAVKDNGDGTYTTTFTGTTAGTNTITATIDGTTVTSTAPSITVTPASVDLAKSTVTLSPASIALNGTTTVTLTAKDADGNQETAGGLTVLFSLGSGTAQGSFGAVTDNNNGTYTATFTGTTTGTNTITATIGGQAVTSTTPTLDVVGAVDLSQSTVSVSPASIALDGTTTVTLTAKDANGNQEPTGGLTVLFSLGAGAAQGSFSAVTDNGNGTYTATFTSTTAGTNTITATIGGQAVTSTAPTLTVVGPFDPTQSTVSVSPASIQLNGTTTVTLTAKDSSGDQETAGGLTVAFALGSGAAQGTFGTVTDNGNGMYTATFTGTTAGANTITATIDGETVTSTAPTVTVVGAVDPTQSTVSVSPASIQLNGTTTVTLTANDANGNQETVGGSTVVFSLGSGAAQGTFGTVTDNGNGTYTATFTGTAVGTNTVTATIGGQAVTTAAPTVIVVGSVDPSQSTISVNPASVQSGGSTTVTLTAVDANGNQETVGGSTVVFSLGSGTAQGTFSSVTDNSNGTYTATFTGTTAGANTITATIDGQTVTSAAPSITVTPGPADPTQTTVSVNPASIQSGATTTVTLTAVDANGNQETTGGSTVVFGLGNGSAQGDFGTVTDNGDGTYTATFIGTTAGANTITATIDGQTVTSSLPSITVTPGPVDPSQTTVAVAPASIQVNGTTTVTLTAEDASGNQETSGGSTVVFSLGSGAAQGNFSSVTDNGNGTYTATFTGTTAGANTVTATIGGHVVTSTAPTVTVT